MTQSETLDEKKRWLVRLNFSVHLMDKDVSSRDNEMVAACALAELFEPKAIVGYTTIDSRSRVATFQTAVYPRLPPWPFS